jgi:hypothetical protein
MLRNLLPGIAHDHANDLTSLAWFAPFRIDRLPVCGAAPSSTVAWPLLSLACDR